VKWIAYTDGDDMEDAWSENYSPSRCSVYRRYSVSSSCCFG
jgi:hypothetical protein